MLGALMKKKSIPSYKKYWYLHHPALSLPRSNFKWQHISKAPAHATKVYTENRGIALLILYLGTRLESVWSAAHPDRFMPRERASGTDWIGGSVGPRAGLDILENRNISCQGQHPDHPAHRLVAIPSEPSQFTTLLYMDTTFISSTERFWREKKIYIYIYIYTGSGRNTWRFGNTVVSGTVGVRNLSLNTLLAILKAFQLPWNTGL